jgi:glycosyltransferase involved in cell wall biosynthesis
MSVAPKYSIVVPVYNSEKTLAELCDRTAALFEKLNLSYQIVLVNDQSVDKSWDVIKDLKKKYGDKLFAIKLSRNFGQHKALLCGFQFARGEYIVTIDDDLQFYPEDIEILIRKADESGADLVYGCYRTESQHSLVRRIGSAFVAFIFEKFGNTSGQGSSFKLIQKSVIEKIKDYNHSFTFLDEILSWHTTHIAYVDVRHAPRRAGKSGYSLPQLIFISINLIFGYTTVPLRFMTWFGLTSFWVCLFFVCYFIYLKLSRHARLGYTALMVTMFMSTGLILFSLGIIGEYLNRLFALQHKKPSYLIKEILR